MHLVAFIYCIIKGLTQTSLQDGAASRLARAHTNDGRTSFSFGRGPVLLLSGWALEGRRLNHGLVTEDQR
jgi:hypothetical protein